MKKFKYLGSIVSSDLKDDLEIDARIKAAGAVFASGAKNFFHIEADSAHSQEVRVRGVDTQHLALWE